MRNHTAIIIIFLVLLVASPLGCTPDSASEDPFSDYTPISEVYCKPASGDRLVTVGSMQAAADQLVVLMEEEATPEDLLAAADAVDGTPVGQIPALGIYQIEVPTGSASDLEAKLLILDERPGVVGAVFNLVPDFKESVPEYCTAPDDVHSIHEGSKRCPLNEVQYFLMVPIVEKVKEYFPVHPVRVAVIDTGIDSGSAQFDDVSILNLDDPEVPARFYRNSGHGTRVAGVIASDNHDGGTNGLASRVLGSDLQLISAFYGVAVPSSPTGEYYSTIMGNLVSMTQASLSAHADVVNMSFGYNFAPGQQLRSFVTNLLFAKVMAHLPSTLFVMAAGNENTELSIYNYAPLSTDPLSGQHLANAVTVGGSAHCAPEVRWYYDPQSGSNYGELVDLAAPSEDVPVLNFYPKNNVFAEDGGAVFRTGTSYSAPTVSALAAILKSLDPTISPEEIKSIMIGTSYATDLQISGAGVQFALAVEKLVLDRLRPPDELRRFIESAEQPTSPELPSFAVNAICGHSLFAVGALGGQETEFDPDQVTGALNDMVLTILMVDEQDPQRQTTVSLSVHDSFHLGTFSIDDPASVTWTVMKADGTTVAVGTGTGGEVTFKSCAILERDGLFHNPLSVWIEGHASGSLGVNIPPSIEVFPAGFSASFHTTAAAMVSDPALLQYLEESCDGGRG